MNRPIVLVGMMGCGKSKVGKLLAEELRMPFYDSDAEIERITQKKISVIFAEDGEAAFRQIECRVIQQLLEKGSAVISTGGGAFVQEATRAIIKEKAVSIYLNANSETLCTRLEHKRAERPLLQGDDWRDTISTMLRDRTPHYLKADHLVVSNGDPAEETAQRIITVLTKAPLTLDSGISFQPSHS